MKLRILTVVSLLVCTSVFNPAFARQCIWNKAGFTLYITWINPAGEIRREDLILSGNGSCSTNDEVFTVILAVKDGQIAKNFTVSALTVGLAALTGGAAIVMEATAGTAWGISTATSLVAAAAAAGIPNPEGTFYSGQPKPGQFLDVWGTVWNPAVGGGGSIINNNIRNNDGGYGGSLRPLWQSDRPINHVPSTHTNERGDPNIRTHM